MKAFHYQDEWYPVQVLDFEDDECPYGREIDVPNELKERYKKAMQEFADVQGEILKVLIEIDKPKLFEDEETT